MTPLAAARDGNHGGIRAPVSGQRICVVVCAHDGRGASLALDLARERKYRYVFWIYGDSENDAAQQNDQDAIAKDHRGRGKDDWSVKGSVLRAERKMDLLYFYSWYSLPDDMKTQQATDE